jgi:hypothetical protein
MKNVEGNTIAGNFMKGLKKILKDVGYVGRSSGGVFGSIPLENVVRQCINSYMFLKFSVVKTKKCYSLRMV